MASRSSSTGSHAPRDPPARTRKPAACPNRRTSCHCAAASSACSQSFPFSTAPTRSFCNVDVAPPSPGAMSWHQTNTNTWQHGKPRSLLKVLSKLNSFVGGKPPWYEKLFPFKPPNKNIRIWNITKHYLIRLTHGKRNLKYNASLFHKIEPWKMHIPNVCATTML